MASFSSTRFKSLAVGKSIFVGDGLYLLATPGGGRSWRFQPRLGGKRLTVTLGRWDQGVTLDDARDRLREAKRQPTLLFELRIGSALRPVDQIEGILNRDKKVATYKLALFRALAEIATQQPHIAHWHSNGEVGINVRAVAERWLAYYWSIIGSEKFFPQTQGEKLGSQKPVKLRRSLQSLTERFNQSGGLTAFSLAFTSGELASDKQTESVLREIEQTIIAGPVKYAGGALSVDFH